jgi:hypothetical protein
MGIGRREGFALPRRPLRATFREFADELNCSLDGALDVSRAKRTAFVNVPKK